MKVLFICTHNRCRSILAEAVCNHLGGGRIEARSAGSQPVGEVHPLSLRYLKEKGISTNGLCSQSWNEHEDWGADVVITVCDSAANEPCPLWFGDAQTVHWGLSDPSKLELGETAVAEAFFKTIDIIESRIQVLLDAKCELLDPGARRTLLEKLAL
jgi:arsenate reductase